MEVLGSGATKFLLFILVLGVLVVFHELGHFLAAKLVGVRVEVYSFGFGNRLFGRRLGDTDYRFSLIPLGGYVRMAGDGVEGEPTGAPHEFDSRKSWEKLLIMGAGPAFNLVLAVLLLAGSFMLGIEVPAFLKAPVRVEHVEADSPAEKAGLVPGDLVTAVDGQPVPDWEHFNEIVIVSPNRSLDLTVVRDGAVRQVPLAVEARTEHAIGWAGLHPCYRILVRGLSAEGPAAAAGFKAGDEILSVGDRQPCTSEALVDAIQASAGTPLAFTLRRGGAETLTLSAAPRWNEEARKWLVGISPGESAGDTIVEHYGFSRAVSASIERNWRHTKLLFTTLGRLVTGGLSVRTMSGPIELADIAQETAALGIVPLLQLMALVSLNLGILNLVPIPLLDGGRIALILVEAARGRALERRTKEWILQAGLVMIVLLMAVVIYFDLVKKLGS